MEFSFSIIKITQCPLYAGLVLGEISINKKKKTNEKSLRHGAYTLVRNKRIINNKQNKLAKHIV